MKKLLTFFLVFLSAIAFNRCSPYDTVTVTDVTVNPATLALATGGSATLTATVIPDNATIKSVIWSSDKPAVATVDVEGKVTAVAEGAATITVTTEDGGKTATCTVTVTSSAPAIVPVTGVSLDKTTLLLAKGVESAESATLEAAITPENATNKNLSWASNNKDVATVDAEGKVTAVAEGTATITVTTKDGDKNAECTVTVFEMVYVEGDTFYNGSQYVILSNYYIGKYEVTQGLWEAVMGTDIQYQREIAKGNKLCGEGYSYPMYYVSWNDICKEATGFLAKLKEKTGKDFKLPTEAQWEFAARGGTRRTDQTNGKPFYIYSGSNNIDEVAWYKENSDSKAHPVGEKKSNELGIYDMTGNVIEWCFDWWKTYSTEPVTDPIGPDTGEYRLRRGGNWGGEAKKCTVFHRSSNGPDFRRNFLGFRLALVP